VRFVSRDEWELMKLHTAEHLDDPTWPYGRRRQAPAAVDVVPRAPQTIQYYSGNYPGKMAD
jgi:hypothetical protein